jgi:hypothetical protein
MECFLQNNFILDALCKRILVDTFFPKVLSIWVFDLPLNDKLCRTLQKTIKKGFSQSTERIAGPPKMAMK